MPPVEDLENPNYKFATEIFSEDGKVLGTYSYSKENRVFVGYNDLSPHIINALIATEDVRFAEHSGIDAIALFRAVVKRGILMQKNAGGGSILLVDDRIKTGATIKLARELLKEARCIKTFAVNGTADYALFDETCFKFPWIL